MKTVQCYSSSAFLTITFALLTSCALAQSMPPVIGEQAVSGEQVDALWDSTQGFSAVRNEPGVSSTTIISDPVIGPAHRMTFSGDGQNYFGGYLNNSSVRNAIADAGQLNVRYLIKFGTERGQAEWAAANRTVMGNVWGPELKAFDFHNGNTSQRIIMMIRNAYGSAGNIYTAGQLVLRIDGTQGEREVYVPEVGGYRTIFGESGTWYYLEIQIRDDGSVRHWFSPYNGSGTEYSQGSPSVVSLNSHSYNFDWLRSSNFDFGYRNHAVDGTRTIDVRLTISTSFIGPGGGQ